MIKIKSSNIITGLAVILVLTAFLLSAIKYNDDSKRFISAETYEILTEWYGENGRRYHTNEKSITDSAQIFTTLKTDGKNKSIIIKSNNLKISAFTKGKVLKTKDDDALENIGEKYTIIDTDGVKKGSVVYLNFEPVKKHSGAFLSPIYFCSENEFYFSVIYKNLPLILALFCMLLLIILLSLKTVKLIINNSKSAGRVSYFTICLILAFCHLFFKSDLSFFIIGSSFIKEVGTYLPLYLLSPAIVTYFASGLKIKNVLISVFQFTSLFYSLLRLIMFLFSFVSLSRAEFLNYIILTVGIIITALIFTQSGLFYFVLIFLEADQEE